MAVEAVRSAAPRQGKSLTYGRFVSLESNQVRLAFPPDAGFHRATVFGLSRQLIEETISTHFGRPLRLLEETGKNALQSSAPSIAEEEARETEARHKDIDAKIATHPAVQRVLRTLGGTIEHVQYLEPSKDPAGASPAKGVAEDTE
jgi:hypothetical protein